MASIRKRGNTYYARFRLPGTKKIVEKSTGESNLGKASRRAEELEEIARGDVGAARFAERLDELHADATGRPKKHVTVRELRDLWISSKTVSDDTLNFYRVTSDSLLNGIGDLVDKGVSYVRTEDLEAWRADQLTACHVHTVNHRIKIVRMMFKFAHERGFIYHNPALAFKTLPREKAFSPKEPFTKEQLKQLLNTCDDDLWPLRRSKVSLREWRSMILFAVYTGQRLGDVATMRWDAVKEREGSIRLVSGKTGKLLFIPLTGALLKHVESLDRGKASEFIHSEAGDLATREGKTGTLSNQFAKILSYAGLREKVAHRKVENREGKKKRVHALSFHSLRHTAVSWLHEAGVPKAVVMELIGHDSVMANQLYTHVGDEALRKAAESMPDFLD